MEMARSSHLLPFPNLTPEMRRSEASGLTIEVKLVLVGHFSCGKTSLMARFVTGSFSDDTECTLGATVCPKTIKVGDKFIKFQIWVRNMVKALCRINILLLQDTAGAERFNCVMPMYYRNAQAAIIVYDVTKYETYKQAKVWIDDLRHKASC
jgi:Ras-related protein Rab-5C